jgi:non-ribosomal peptide synthetase component E (peptide arylation enzyme)
MDDDGYVRITGRLKDLIIRGGENIPVAEIESLLAAHAAVEDVAVVAVPDLRLGERACAVVVPACGVQPTLPSLNAVLADAGLTKQFWPERLVLMPALPRTPTGKLARGEVRASACRRLAGTSLGANGTREEAACVTR